MEKISKELKELDAATKVVESKTESPHTQSPTMTFLRDSKGSQPQDSKVGISSKRFRSVSPTESSS